MRVQTVSFRFRVCAIYCVACQDAIVANEALGFLTPEPGQNVSVASDRHPRGTTPSTTLPKTNSKGPWKIDPNRENDRIPNSQHQFSGVNSLLVSLVKYFFHVHAAIGEDEPNLTHIFSKWWFNHPTSFRGPGVAWLAARLSRFSMGDSHQLREAPRNTGWSDVDDLGPFEEAVGARHFSACNVLLREFTRWES